MFKFKFLKAIKGEHFDGLDLLTKLLTPNTAVKENPTRPLIEEISSESNEDHVQDGDENDDEDDEIDWFIEQKLHDDSPSHIDLTNSTVTYGFSNKKSNVFSKLSVNSSSNVHKLVTFKLIRFCFYFIIFAE